MKASRLLITALRDPASVEVLDVQGWTALLTAARAERLLGTLAQRVDARAAPPSVARILADARAAPPSVARILADARAGAAEERRAALWEAEMARRALAPPGIPMVLLKGTAFVAAGLDAGQGRSIGDLDILVPREALPAAETALRTAGWEWVKEDAYDDSYYRRWMHELPPLIHRDRDRMIDVHHTILPPTARPKPDAEALLADAVPLRNGLSVLSNEDMIIHAAAHLFADGDLSGGLRNLWDIDRLIREFDGDGFWVRLRERAERHQLLSTVERAARQANELYGTPIPESWRVWDSGDPLYKRRLLARDGWGRQSYPFTRLYFFVRSHWLRMPPLMLARHLFIKATRKPA